MARTRTRLTAVVLALVGVLMTGCSDDPPAASPPPSPTSSPTTAPTTPTGPPTLPAEARGSGPRAAEAFVRHYVDLINYATATLDTAPMRAQSLASCANCQTIFTIAANMREANRRYTGGVWEIQSVEEAPSPKGQWQFQVVVTVSELRVISDDVVRETVPETRTLVTVTLKRQSAWKVAAFTGLES